MKKLLSGILVVVLLMSVLSVNVFAEKRVISEAEMKVLLEEMNRVFEENSSKINALEEGSYEWEVTTKDNLSGTIFLEVEKVKDKSKKDKSKKTGDIGIKGMFPVDDGNWVYTIKYSGLGIGGWVQLKTYYTVYDSAQKATATNAVPSANPPLLYYVSYMNADYTQLSSCVFQSTGVYTYSLLDLHITYEVECAFLIVDGVLHVTSTIGV